jgi:hypothetical protein
MVDNSTNNGILVKPQNYFNDKPTVQISHIPLVNLAYISNSSESQTPVTNYVFNTIQLNYADFMTCFFNSILNNFNISNSNAEVQALSLQQVYIDTTNSTQKFNLNNAVLFAWAEKNNSTISSLSVKEKITLNKNTLMTRSIGSFMEVQNALSWNEAIQTLLESGEITYAKGNLASCAVIDFKITVQYIYIPLNVSINMQYTYRVNVPGYMNKAVTNPCYSSDSTPQRTTFDFKLSEYDQFKNDKLNSIPEDFNETVSETASVQSNEKKDSNNYFMDDNASYGASDVVSLIADTVNESRAW